MKISLVLGNREQLSTQTARGCVATNIALPGFGSLMAGYAVGYAQAAFTVVGFGLTTVFGLKFVVWCLANWSTIYGLEADPLETWISIWRGTRWALLGMGLFVIAWLWTVATNATILRQAHRTEETDKPPKLN